MSQPIFRAFGPGPPNAPSRAPAHLSSPAKRWWRSIVEGYDLEPHHMLILTAAAEAWDRKEEARRVIAEDGLIVHAPSGVLAPHPAVQIEDLAVVRMARLLREIGLDGAPIEDGRAPETRWRP